MKDTVKRCFSALLLVFFMCGIILYGWSKREQANVLNSDMTHEGIQVCVMQNPMEDRRVWYPDEAAFLRDFGMKEKEPFYEYYNPEGTLQMVFYYDAQTKEGLGIRYYERDPTTFYTSGVYGFTFEGITSEKWSGLEIDCRGVKSVHGTDGSKEAENYVENYQYGKGGRVTHFDSQGVLTWLDETEDVHQLLWIDFDYHDNGALQRRSYWHNSFVFETGSTTRESVFDEQERLLFEDVYNTHGSYDYYYIYEDNTEIPAYCLILDLNMGDWIPEFVQYD